MDSEYSATEFLLTIYTVNLTVKFPCKMTIQYDGKPISPEISSKAGVFTFNQDLKIKIKAHEEAQLNIYLSTGKNGNILAGVLYLSSTLLESRQGDKMTVGLQKCLDPSALCSIKVNHLWKIKDKPTFNLAKSSVGGFVRKNRQSPQSKKVNKNTSYEGIETKSDYQGYQLRKNLKETWGPYYKPSHAEKYQKMNYEKEKIKHSAFRSDLLEEKTQQFMDGKTYDRNKKKKNESFNETENNLKLDLMKQKTKNDELERNVTDKNKTIKELKDQILQLERKKLEKQYIEEEMNSKENTIKILEDRISNLTTENNMFRQTITENQKTIVEIKDKVRFDILQNKEDYEKRQHSLKIQLNTCKGKINELDMECSNKTSQILKAKKYIEDLETAAQEKIFQHDQLTQNIKKQYNILIQDLERKNGDLDERIQNLNEKLSGKTLENSKLNQTISVRKQQIRNLQARISSLQSQKTELQPFKRDFYTTTKKCFSLEETLKEEQKQHEKQISNKNKEIGQIQEENSRTIGNWEAKLAAAYEKSKQLKNKISDLENSVLFGKNEEERMKKEIEKLNKVVQTQNEKNSKLEGEVKESQTRIQILQKNLQQKSHKFSHQESLFKIEIQHNRENTRSLNVQLSSFEEKFIKAQSQLQTQKSEKVKLQNKIQLMEDAAHRSSEYLKEKKQEFETKQNQFKEAIKSLTKNVKDLEEAEKTKQKQLNNWEIVDLNLKNKIDQQQKHLKESVQKIEKLEKTIIPKLEAEKKSIFSQLEDYKEKFKEAVDENKYILNERTKLQSETNKNTKINSVLNEEKLTIMNDLNKAKNNLQRAEKKEESLNVQIKGLNEQIKKLTLKNEFLQKENIKNKQIVSQTMNNLVNRFSSKEHLQSTRSLVMFDLSKSRFNPSSSQTHDVKKMLQLIQTTSRQQENSIISLEETNRQYKEAIEKIQNQFNLLSNISKQNQEKNNDTIEKMSEELVQLHQRLLSNTQQYEDRLSEMHTQLNKKEKDMKIQKQNFNTLKYELDTVKKRMQTTVHDSEMNENELEDKIEQLSAQINFRQNEIKNLQTQRKELEKKVYQLEEEVSFEKDEIMKRDKYIHEINEKFSRVKKQAQELHVLKKENTQSLMNLKEEINATKEENSKIKEMLKEEEESKKKVQEFTNSILKQKENIVKAELQATSKVYQLEGKVLQLNTIVQNKEEECTQKDQQIQNLKGNLKEITQNFKNLQIQIGEEKTKSGQLNSKGQDKDKKIGQLESAKSQLNQKYEQFQAKYKRETTNMKEQYQQLSKASSESIAEKNKRIAALEQTLTLQEETISKQSTQLSQYEETVFFERQKLSLAESTINQMKKENSEHALIIKKIEQQITILNEELTVKEEKLFEYSGLLYQMQQKIQSKDTQLNYTLERAENNWKYKIDELCEEYEGKLESLQKEKFYFKNKIQEYQYEKSRALNEAKSLEEQYSRELTIIKQKEKEHETEKIHKIGEKNKQIDKLKEDINNLQNIIKTNKMQAKKSQHELHLKEQAVKKLEGKIEESDKMVSQMEKSYQTQINSYKSKEIGFKSYKEEIKNSQWVVEREIKKICQGFIQKIVTCFPEGKDKLSQPIRQFQNSMATAVNFKI